jgi:hypothetical protein
MEDAKPIVSLTCACCSDSTRGRQWHNRDTGYGICSKCVEWLTTTRKTASEEMASLYGVAGVHYNIPACSRCGKEQENGHMVYACARCKRDICSDCSQNIFELKGDNTHAPPPDALWARDPNDVVCYLDAGQECTVVTQ